MVVLPSVLVDESWWICFVVCRSGKVLEDSDVGGSLQEKRIAECVHTCEG